MGGKAFLIELESCKKREATCKNKWKVAKKERQLAKISGKLQKREATCKNKWKVAKKERQLARISGKLQKKKRQLARISGELQKRIALPKIFRKYTNYFCIKC
ncbi:hypothetical protein [Gracilibacillus sp. JCM 18860]|uniref:hypothetical protein n=1 Tax=Gracilibacillus sp. JCM 18860 TaxID=1306159 RepID=UPI0006D12B67